MNTRRALVSPTLVAKLLTIIYKVECQMKYTLLKNMAILIPSFEEKDLCVIIKFILNNKIPAAKK